VTAKYEDYDTAVRAFWAGRNLQTQKQVESGNVDAGTRGSVTGRPIFRTDPTFDNSSYTSRYQILFDRLVRERLYDAACLISTVNGEGIYAEPRLEVSTINLTAAIAGRIAYIQGIM